MNGTGDSTEAHLGNGRTVVLAKPVSRIVARFLDMLVLSPVVLVFVGTVVAEGIVGLGNSVASLGGDQYRDEVPIGVYLFRWAAVLVLVLYAPMMVALRGVTVGKRTMGIGVVRYADGTRPSAGSSLLRWAMGAVPILAGIALLVRGRWSSAEEAPGVGLAVVLLGVWVLVHASALWDPRWRGWRDKLAGTIVVRVNSAAD